jgi:hypothetical protein
MIVGKADAPLFKKYKTAAKLQAIAQAKSFKINIRFCHPPTAHPNNII